MDRQIESVIIDGIERGQWMEVDRETYDRMKDQYIEMIAEFREGGVHWDYETQFFFQIWLYEKLNGIEH